MSKLANYLITRAKRTPYRHLEGYMERYWLVPYVKASNPLNDVGTGWVPWTRPIARILQHLGIAIRVHKILRSDLERFPHNHPWNWWISLILKGPYLEEIYDSQGNYVRSIERSETKNRIVIRGRNSFHKIKLALVNPQEPFKEYIPVWTLFITIGRAGSWGFNDKGKVTPWDGSSRNKEEG